MTIRQHVRLAAYLLLITVTGSAIIGHIDPPVGLSVME